MKRFSITPSFMPIIQRAFNSPGGAGFGFLGGPLFSLLLLFLLLRHSAASAAPGELDPSFDIRGFSSVTSRSSASAFLIQPDDKVIAIGSFDHFHAHYCNQIVRLNTNGSADLTFDTGGSISDGSLSCLALQPDGKILVAGRFTSFNGTSANSIVRLNTNGSLDTAFALPVLLNLSYQPVSALNIQADGRVVAVSDYGVVRLNSNGAIDSTFTNIGAAVLPPESAPRVVAFQADGKILITGTGLLRLNADGTRDTNFGVTVNGPINTVVQQADGKLLIGGAFAQVNGTPQNGYARLNPDGSLDATFNNSGGAQLSSGSASVSKVVLQPGGKILLLGKFNSVNLALCYNTARLNGDGSLDATFASPQSGNGFAQSVGIDSQGRLLNFSDYNEGVIRRFMDGTVDRTFATGSFLESKNVYSLIWYNVFQQPDAKLIIIGNANGHGIIPIPGLARLNPDGTLDTTYFPEFSGGAYLRAVGLQRDGRAIIAGSFDSINAVKRTNIARLNLDGSVDLSFQTNFLNSLANIYVHQVLPQADDKLIVVYSYYDLTDHYQVLRLNPDGSIDTNYAGRVSDNFFYAWIQSDGKLVLNDPFIRFNLDGSVDTSFSATNNSAVRISQMAFQSDGKIIFGGYSNGTAVVARLLPTGAVDPTFRSVDMAPANGSASSVTGVCVDSQDRIIIVGKFTHVNATVRNNLARLNPDGSLDLSFSPLGAGPTSPDYASLRLRQAADGRLLVYGSKIGRYFGGDSAPAVTRGPQSQTVNTGDSVVLSVTATGTAPLSYQWRFAGLPLAGATNTTLTLTNIQAGQSGFYDVVIANAAGSITSIPPASISVLPPVAITNQPLSQSIVAGQTLSLSVGVSGGSGNSFQWQFNGTNIIGATQPTLNVTNVKAANAGAYQAVISNAAGSVSSAAANIFYYGDLSFVASTVLAGPIGQLFRVDYADVLAPGTTNWQVLTNITLPSSPFLVIDPASASRTNRFYRAVPVP